jgi:Carboxypeptidase regulatory-like domain/TonB-dependent Receptor Plug Domain
MKRAGVGLALLLSFLCSGGMALAQAGGNLTGTIEGIVKVGDSPVPGVLVTISSPALQGKRSVATGANGDYIFRQLPPGTYAVSFTLTGMKTVQRSLPVTLGGTSRQDATLEVSTAAVAVTVSGANIAAEEEKAAVHSSTFSGETIQTLPIARRLDQIASLAPGLTSNTPNAGQLSISGAFAYDNKFLLNGVDINDNLFGTATDQLVIEEAVQETQVMTSNVSAEYGGFSGGIINAITKSGGNVYSGSARVDFSNPDWQAFNPNEAANRNTVTRAPDLSETYSATLGGKIITDRLWFFLAGRYITQTQSTTLPVTSESVSTPTTEPRLEGKLTGNINESHTLQFDYTYSNQKQTNAVPFPFTAESSGDFLNAETPASVLVASYNGVFTPALLGSLRYSEKKFQFKGSGGTVTDVVAGTPFFSDASGTQDFLHYHAPYFDATDPEDRNNRDIAGSLSYYVSAGKLGSHELKAGADIYTSIHTGGNSQSPTNFVMYADYKTDAAGKPVFDANHHLIPTFVPNVSFRNTWLATRGAEADLKTNAFYINDSVRIDRFSFNLGFRYETVKGTGPGGSTITDTHAFVPRLGAVWDVKGDGRYQVGSSYAQYAGKYNDSQFNQSTVVGNPNLIQGVYTGPAGEGFDFAPAFDNANYSTFNASFPLANVFFGTNVSAPITTEFTLSAGGKITPTFSAAATYVWRDTKNFVEDFIDNPTAAGKTEVISGGVDYGLFDNKYFRNTDVPKRRYQALLFQTSFSGVRDLQLQANYTYMLKFEGNFAGENTNQPGISSPFGDYPEVVPIDRTAPFGNLAGFQRHKLRLIGAYNLRTPIGIFTPGVIYNFDSGTPYSVTTTYGLTDIQKARDPGYANLPNSQTIYFGGRGSGTFPSQQRWDVSLDWNAPTYKTVAPYVRFAIRNVFNTAYLVSFNTTAIVPNDGKTVNGVKHPDGPLDANGLPTTFSTQKDENNHEIFGTATSSTDYQPSRTLTVAAGIRF